MVPRAIAAVEAGVFERTGETIGIAAWNGATALLRSGPFLMNTEEEIRQATLDSQSGKMGRLR